MELHNLEVFKSLQPDEYLKHFIESGERSDGRAGLKKIRNVSISCGTITTADSSAIVKQGNTIVVCGITLELAPPKADDPNSGFVVPNIDFPPLCHGQFKPGPPSERAQIASQFLHEVLSNSDIVNKKELCIKEGKLCWVLKIDLTCLNHDGSVLDCALKAMVAALKNLKLPYISFLEDEDETVSAREIIDVIQVREDKKSALKIGAMPIGCTVAAFKGEFLVDPTEEEEALADMVVTVVLDSFTGEVCHFKKSCGAPMTREKIQECTAVTKKVAKQIKVLMDSAIGIK